MRRLLALPVLFASGVAYGWYRGFAAPLLYGASRWAACFRSEPCNEADWPG